jgi:para-aminobenzoate synthetase/4-amino-4-deoxychorismate lyase
VVLCAEEARDVERVLRAVEEGVADGLYAAGFLSYEAAPAFDAAFRTHPRPAAPLAWFGLFEAPWTGSVPSDEDDESPRDWRPSIAETDYGDAIGRIRDAIAAGETYQVNYTLRLRAEAAGVGLGLYERLRRAQGPGYHAYLDVGRFRILSASPELFFQWKSDEITVRPMKGTAPRGRFAEEDAARAASLAASDKDRAENVMIVDMMRSDLGRIAVPGSVRVDRLFEVETYPTVHQMTSSISARTATGTRLTDVFRALFPSASITGAPKVSTMGWIADLEGDPRNVYCGAIGYVAPRGESVFSVPIRTLLVDTQSGTAEYGVGGGVTWDSTREGEYKEAWLKAGILFEDCPAFDLLETLLLEEGRFRLLKRHLNRLEASARYFAFSTCGDAARAALAAFADAHPKGLFRVRLTASPDGQVHLAGMPLSEPRAPRLFALADEPVNSTSRFLYHKTTFRDVYERRRGEDEDVYDVLMWNERGEITEFTTGNVALEIGGALWTPPVACGVLPGTFRARMLEEGALAECVLTRADLAEARRVWFLNSVRGWVELFAVGRGGARRHSRAGGRYALDSRASESAKSGSVE